MTKTNPAVTVDMLNKSDEFIKIKKIADQEITSVPKEVSDKTKPKVKKAKEVKVDPRDAEILTLKGQLQVMKNRVKTLTTALAPIANAKTRHRALYLVADALKKIK